jgi:PST family polysaccharide transporter
LKKRSVRGFTTSLVGEGIDFVLRVGSMSILARMLLPEYFGLLTMVMVVTAVVDRLKDLGLTVVTIQRKTITHEEVSTLFWINAAGGLAMALIVAACAYPLALFYQEPRLIPITLAMATTFIWTSLTVQHSALLNRQMKYAHLAAIQISTNALSLAVAIVLAWAGAGYWALIAREALRTLFIAAGVWMCFPWVPSLPSRKARITSMLSFGGDLTVLQPYLLRQFGCGQNSHRTIVWRRFAGNVQTEFAACCAPCQPTDVPGQQCRTVCPESAAVGS